MSSPKALYQVIMAAAALAAAACSDRPRVTAPVAAPNAASAAPASQNQLPEGLARQFARALGNPAFRAYVKAALDSSPYREHKLQFQMFIGRPDRRALRELAAANGATTDEIERGARAAIPLEVYLPVPAHRAGWQGDSNVLVATAIKDKDVPVAFDIRGHRQLLDPDTPPSTPVIALVPVETDFSPKPQRQACLDCGGTGGGGGPLPTGPAPGLYMTKAHFVQTFESWLKGDPEFEAHILGQLGASDSLKDYQCAGEHAGGPYTFDQNDKDWSGSVLLFSQQQISDYNAAHPGQNMRVFFVEDDDTACEIKTDPSRFQALIARVDSVYSRLTTGNDSSLASIKAWKYGRAAYSIWQALASWIKSNDELVGNAVQDQIVGSFYPGYNWFVKGENNITNGWVNLVLY
jgi:hypothetical protein